MYESCVEVVIYNTVLIFMHIHLVITFRTSINTNMGQVRGAAFNDVSLTLF